MLQAGGANRARTCSERASCTLSLTHETKSVQTKKTSKKKKSTYCTAGGVFSDFTAVCASWIFAFEIILKSTFRL